MNRRMLTTLVALVGFFVALYLALYKTGVIGTLACGSGGCETVQTSRWADFLGIPVAVWGVAFYALVFALAFLGTLDRWAHSRPLAATMLGLTAWGVVFSGWLTWLELFVIHAICRWCVVSAVIAVALFILVALDWRSTKARTSDV
jgi:uncharacterized membrane protein